MAIRCAPSRCITSTALHSPLVRHVVCLVPTACLLPHASLDHTSLTAPPPPFPLRLAAGSMSAEWVPAHGLTSASRVMKPNLPCCGCRRDRLRAKAASRCRQTPLASFSWRGRRAPSGPRRCHDADPACRGRGPAATWSVGAARSIVDACRG